MIELGMLTNIQNMYLKLGLLLSSQIGSWEDTQIHVYCYIVPEHIYWHATQYSRTLELDSHFHCLTLITSYRYKL